MLRCKLTAVGIEYNYAIVIAQNKEIKKKKFCLSLRGFGPDHGH